MQIITSEGLAKSLDNFNAEDRFTRSVIKLAKDNNLIIVSAIGNDTITFNGALTDEFELFKGGDIFMAKEVFVPTIEGHKEIIEYVPYLKQSEKKDRIRINVFWEKNRLYTWKFLTIIPHAKFTIKKDNKYFCQGIIFSLNDI